MAIARDASGLKSVLVIGRTQKGGEGEGWRAEKETLRQLFLWGGIPTSHASPSVSFPRAQFENAHDFLTVCVFKVEGRKGVI
jgi:hypothetical protein